MSNYVNKVIKDEVTHSIYDARILELPDEQTSDLEVGQTIKSVYIDTSKTIDWSYATPENGVMAEVSYNMQEINFATEEPQNPEEGNFWWKDGNTFKVYNTNTKSWDVFMPTIIDATTYVFYFKYDKDDPSESLERDYLRGGRLDGTYLNTTSDSSAPDPQSYQAYYNTNSQEFYKSIENGGSYSWELIPSSDYIILDNTMDYIYFSNADVLYCVGYDFHSSYAIQYGEESGMIYAVGRSMTEQNPTIGTLVCVGIDTESINPNMDGMLMANKDFPEYGIVGNQWMVSSGSYALDEPTTYRYFSEVFNNIFNGSIKASVLPAVENGQYYKDKDKAESRELLENGMMISTLTFPTYNKGEGKVDFSSLLDNVTPSATYNVSIDGVDGSIKQYTLFRISAGPEAMIMQVISMYVAGEPEPGYTMEGTENLLFMFPVEVNSAEIFEETIDDLMDYSFYMEMDMTQGSQHQYDSQWGGDKMEEPDENGTFQIGGTVMVGDLSGSAKPFIDENMLAKYSPASIGDLLRCVDGELLPLAVGGSSSVIYGRLHTNYLNWSDYSDDVFKYYGYGYNIYLTNSDKDNIKLDSSKDYIFEVINNDPVWFANQGFALSRAEVNQDGSVNIQAYRIKNNEQNNIYIKITEGGI